MYSHKTALHIGMWTHPGAVEKRKRVQSHVWCAAVARRTSQCDSVMVDGMGRANQNAEQNAV